MINVQADRQALDEQVKNMMLQLHTSQLECQMLKTEDEIEGVDLIKQKLVGNEETEVFFHSSLNLGRRNNQTTGRI